MTDKVEVDNPFVMQGSISHEPGSVCTVKERFKSNTVAIVITIKPDRLLIVKPNGFRIGYVDDIKPEDQLNLSAEIFQMIVTDAINDYLVPF